MTEDELRRELISILNVTHGISNVMDNCGSIEFGIDILFQDENTTFKTISNCGIQLKVGDITASGSGATGSVKEIIGQIAIAFGHRFRIGETDTHLDAIYIITTGEMNSHAREYINAINIGIRNIKFLYGQKLDEFLVEGRARVQRLQIHE